MRAPVLLKIASGLTVIHAALHTFGGLLHAPSHGPGEIAVLDAMKSFQFDVMGSRRTYWDFYFGFGLFVSVSLLLQAALLWQLASLAKSQPDKARPLMASLFLAFVAAVVLSWRWFFIAPLLMEALIAILVGWAYVLSGRRGFD
jgi:hypothetical protein